MLAVTEKHIRAYNALDGKRPTKEQLQTLHASIRADIKAKKVDKFSPLGIELFGVEARLAKALRSQVIDEFDIVRVKQIDVDAYLKLRATPVKPKVITRTIVKTVTKKIKAKPIAMDLGFTADGQAKIYEIVNNMVLKEMNKSGLFWRKPWSVKRVGGISTLAQNFKTKTVYTGINYWTTNFIARSYGCNSPFFLSVQQTNDMGGTVKEGSKVWPILFYTFIYELQKPTKRKITEEEYNALSAEQRKDVKKFPVVQYYNVVNADHIEGIKFPAVTAGPEIPEAQKVESCEKIVEGMPKRPPIGHGGDRAFYSSGPDKVQMPLMTTFDKEQEYYGTLFHELIHSTGHPKRIGRTFGRKFGDKQYAFEELIAELGASYLCAESGTLYFTLNNTAAYLKSWGSKLTKALKSDDKFFVHAAAAAQRAANFILDVDADEAAEGKVVKDEVAKEDKIATPKRMKRTVLVVDDVPSVSAVAGFFTADKAPEKPKNMFVLHGEIGKLLGEQQRYRLQIIMDGEKSSSKSELAKQLADSFIDIDFKVALIDYEMGGLESKDTQAGIDRNLKPGNKKKLFVSDAEFPANIEAIKKIATSFDVIIIDSGSKLNQVTNVWLDELRTEYPDTIWVVLMQQNSKGGTKGGTAAGYNAPVVIKTYRPDPTNQMKNYAWVEKNRGNLTDKWYLIAQKRTVTRDPGLGDIEEPQSPVPQPQPV